MAETIEERFKKAVWLIRNGPPEKSSTETKLLFYSYFKQVKIEWRQEATTEGASERGEKREQNNRSIGFCGGQRLSLWRVSPRPSWPSPRLFDPPARGKREFPSLQMEEKGKDMEAEG